MPAMSLETIDINRKLLVKNIFVGALDCPAQFRDIWLETNCQGDSDLHKEVSVLLGFVAKFPEVVFEPPIGTLVGRFRIVRLLGEGGMGKVYEGIAEEPWSGPNAVAIKFIDKQNNEPSLLRKIEHANVVTIFEEGNKPSPWFAMELVPLAENIIDGVATHARTLEERLDIIIEVCEGVSAIHHAGLIHGDISPNNILIDSSGHVHITDLGLGKIVDTKNKKRLGGTLAFMAPEQFDENAKSTTQTDVYAVCAVLYRLLCGFNPFPVPTEYRAAKHVVTQLKPIPPRSFSPNIPVELENLLLRGLSKDPSKRPQDGTELGFLLQSHRDGTIPKHKSHKVLLVSLLAIFLTALFAIQYFSDTLSSYSNLVLEDNPVGYWTLDERTEVVHNLGSAGTRLDGIVSDDVSLGFEGGMLFRAGGIEIPTHSSLHLSGPMTIELWFKLDEVDNLGTTYALAKGRDLDAGFYRISMGRAGELIYIRAAGHNGVPVLDAFVDAAFDDWHYLVWVISPDIDLQQLWLDGQLVTFEVIPGGLFGTNDGNLFIGRHGNKNASYMHRGVIDDVAIYQKALTKDQFIAHWKSH